MAKRDERQPFDMRVIISPAKKMRGSGGEGARGRSAGDDAACDAFPPTGIPPFPQMSARILAELRAKSRAELQAIWKVSEALLEESCGRTAALELPMSWEDACVPQLAARLVPALFSYDGIQYQSLAPQVLDEPALTWLQRHLLVLSALHGCVRPFDAVMPYRLEMGARLPVGDARDLYAFWGPTLGAYVAADREGEASAGVRTCVVNLASVEYAKAVLPFLPAGTPAVTCIFGEALKDGKPVQRSTASKTARGSMVRWLAETRPSDPADLRLFDVGYRYDEDLSREVSRGAICASEADSLPATLVFMRKD